jgi:hypothetical protein
MTKARDLANASTALSAVTATELGYVDGVTSAIQTQIDAKAPTSTTTTLTGTQTLTNKTLTSPVINTAVFTSAEETVNLVATGFAGYTYNTNNGTFVYIYANATADGVVNFRGDASNTLNSLLSTGQSISCTLVLLNGATPYRVTSVTIDGSAPAATVWSGGTAPAAGNASSRDAYSFTIVKLDGAPTWLVLAAGPIKYA